MSMDVTIDYVMPYAIINALKARDSVVDKKKISTKHVFDADA